MSNQTKKILAVVGATGSGKTALAVKLAQKFNGVLVSADSRQVYQGLDVGTNKEGRPGSWHGQPARFIGDIPQLLVDVAQPGERFTLNDWLEQASYALKSIMALGQLPIIVGGTGLYVTALLDGYQPGQGRGAKVKKPVDIEALILQIEANREILNKKSDERFVRIYDQLLVETKKLLAAGVPGDWLDNIGLDYRYAFKGITGELTREETVSQFQAASRQYIRRQLTWWRHHNQPLLVKNRTEAKRAAAQFLGKKVAR